MTAAQYGPITAWSRTVLEMDAEHARAIARSEAVRVVPQVDTNLWQVETGSHVGVLTGEGWELRIRPKLAIPRLLFLLAYSAKPTGWKDLVAGFGTETDLLDAIASGFSWHLERSLEQGVLRGYVTIEERRQDLRGRIRFGDQMARNPGLPLPLEVTYDDFTTDIPENRLVLTAAETMLRLPRVPARARSRLLRARAILEDVEPLRDARGVRAPAITRLNARYAPALALAELIVNAQSTTPEYDETRSTTFLFDMNEVFESFLYAALREAFNQFSGEIKHHHADVLDTDPGTLRIEPDITWWRAGKCEAVIDAKYKSLVDRKTMPNADAYQMLAYCITLGIPRGYLIYAKDGNQTSSQHTVKRHHYVLETRAIDVELEPQALLAQVAMIANEVASKSAVAA